MASNGGLLYHEVQEANLCAVHCLNALLQGPFFSAADLSSLASDVDRAEHDVLPDPAAALLHFSDNVSPAGDFSIQVLQKALEVWNLQVIPSTAPSAKASDANPELENAFICHMREHWFCIRKVNGEWYDFNSLYAAPRTLSSFYLSSFLDTLKATGWSIFLVRGNFPTECTLPSSGHGQWLTREDAERIMKPCKKSADDAYATLEEEDRRSLETAIALSLEPENTDGDESTKAPSSLGKGTDVIEEDSKNKDDSL